MLRRDNHFVPQLYLKRWSFDGYKIYGYRTLVSHRNVPEWNTYSIRGIANQSDLYTRLSADGETDEFERWLETEFETPVEEAIYKVTTDKRLSAEDWKNLIRFAASQCVRTPAQMMRNMERWSKELPEILDTTLNQAITKLKGANKTGIPIKTKNTVNTEIFPLSISREQLPDSKKTILKVETSNGRSLWLWGIKHLLTETLNVLLEHRWSILRAAPNFNLITSDDPVLCLNYYSKGSYDFGGGWGRKGSEILLPLSPHHMLYTRVGAKQKSRVEISYELCTELQQMIAAHSHRWIFAYEPISEIKSLRPRLVDPIMYKNEAEAWSIWHDHQSNVEQDLISKSKER